MLRGLNALGAGLEMMMPSEKNEIKIVFGKIKTRNDVLRYETKSDGKYILFHRSGDWWTAMNVSAWVCERKLGIRNKYERYQYDEGFRMNVKMLARKEEVFTRTVKEPIEKLGAKIYFENKYIIVFCNPIEVTRGEILEYQKGVDEQEKLIETLLLPDKLSPEQARRIVEINMELNNVVKKDLPKGVGDSVGEELFHLANNIAGDEIQMSLSQCAEERSKWNRKLLVDVQVFSAALMGTFNAGMLTNKRAIKIGKMLRDILHEGR